MKRNFCALMAIAVVFISTVLPQAQAMAAQQVAPPKAIVGSWIETITVTAGAPPPFTSFKSVGVYGADGTVVFSDQGDVTLDPPQSLSTGIGSWTYIKGRTFAWTVVQLISDLSGNLVGTLKVRGESTLDASGNAYTSRWHADALDPNGGLLFAADRTNTGQRIMVEPLP